MKLEDNTQKKETEMISEKNSSETRLASGTADSTSPELVEEPESDTTVTDDSDNDPDRPIKLPPPPPPQPS
jgi:hypothetical protein